MKKWQRWSGYTIAFLIGLSGLEAAPIPMDMKRFLQFFLGFAWGLAMTRVYIS
jgi:hypothetical protein